MSFARKKSLPGIDPQNGADTGDSNRRDGGRMSAPGAMGPGSLPTRARSGFRFRITAEGFTLLLIMVLVGFAAWHSGTNLLYLIFAILVALFLLQGIHLSWNLSGLRIQEFLPEYATAGEPFSVEVELENTKRFFSSSCLRVDHFLAGEKESQGAVFFLKVPRRQKVETVYSTSLPRRGLYTFNRVELSTRYPFSFEERAPSYAMNRQILVLPRANAISPELLPVPHGFGDQESTRRGSGSELYGFREYVNGEPSRLVHWRTSARAQKLMVAEFTREEQRRMVLVLDNRSETAAKTAGDSVEQDGFEKAITLTASLARYYLEKGYEVGLQTLSDDLPPVAGGMQLLEIRRALALLQLEGGGTPPAEPKDAAIYVHFSDSSRLQDRSGASLAGAAYHLHVDEMAQRHSEGFVGSPGSEAFETVSAGVGMEQNS